tara:strand:- start:2218 stop:2391 length:174 start_codon:yes stop_codon:yes gene_type:complete
MIKFTRKELWMNQAGSWNFELDEFEMLEKALAVGFVKPVEDEDDLYLVNEEYEGIND